MKKEMECKLEVAAAADDSGKIMISGVMNFDSVMLLNQQASRLFPEFKSIIIDLSGVTYVNSAGLALLLDWKRSAVLDKRTIKILSIPQKLINIARVSEIGDILSLH
jgi:phospholipid transport system transporter-binding protein